MHDPKFAGRASAVAESGNPGSDHPGHALQSGEHMERDAERSYPEASRAGRNVAAFQRADSPLEAEGRRTISTAFVRMGPDRHLTVVLRDGRVLVLRDVTMHPKKYCGMRAGGTESDLRYCGRYGEIAAARPGTGPAAPTPDPG